MPPADPSPSPRRTLTLEDPAALRALAHPARQRVVTALYAGREALTATQAARLCGLSASAMSYHLRALEKWGIVRRGESADGRERPWLAAADDFTVPASAYRSIDAALGNALLSSWTQQVIDALARTATTIASGADDLSSLRNLRLWLTREEAVAVHEAIDSAIQPYRDRSSRNHPNGSVPMDAYLLLLPADPHSLASEPSPRR